MKEMAWRPNLDYMINNELFIISSLLTTDRFISYCRDRGIEVSKEQLEQFEKLGIFYPVARVEYPEEIHGYISIFSQKNVAAEWLKKGLIWEPSSRKFKEWDTFKKSTGFGDKIINYYSIFQCYPLYMLIELTTINSRAEFLVDYDVQKLTDDANKSRDIARLIIAANQRKILANEDNTIIGIAFRNWRNKSIWRGIAALLCQMIANRFFPETQSDHRSIIISPDILHYRNWDWFEYCRKWDAKSVLSEIGLNDNELKTLHEIVASEADQIDPLEDWYELISFIAIDKKEKLKNIALLSQNIYSMEKMLRLLYEEATGKKLDPKEIPPFRDVDNFYGLNTTEDQMQYLELLVNRYHLNPKPKLILVVEGHGESEQFPNLSEKLLGYSFQHLGIEVINLQGVGDFTGIKRRDRYGALEKFIDYHHSHQTIVFVILDNEGNVAQVKNQLVKAKSRYNPERSITLEEYIYLWDRCIEFDNFSHEEIADIMTKLCDREYHFTEEEIRICQNKYDSKQSDPLPDLFLNKTHLELSKRRLLEMLFKIITDNGEKELEDGQPKRKLVQVLIKIVELASGNFQPSTKEILNANQRSGYFGDIRH